MVVAWDEDLGVVDGEVPESIWQWEEVRNLLAACHGLEWQFINANLVDWLQNPPDWCVNFPSMIAAVTWAFRSLTIISTIWVPFLALCGNMTKLIGRELPSAAYPPGLCSFISMFFYCGFFCPSRWWVRRPGSMSYWHSRLSGKPDSYVPFVHGSSEVGQMIY